MLKKAIELRWWRIRNPGSANCCAQAWNRCWHEETGNEYLANELAAGLDASTHVLAQCVLWAGVHSLPLVPGLIIRQLFNQLDRRRHLGLGLLVADRAAGRRGRGQAGLAAHLRHRLCAVALQDRRHACATI